MQEQPNTSTRLISSEIEFSQLPPFFQHGLSITDTPVSADMLLIAMLTATSSVLPRFYFRHGFPEHKYHANLMSLVIAPPASGKGIMNLSNRLVEWRDHMIAGNSSLSAFLGEMERLNGQAYMMETEADVMSKTLRVDNNDYSYILRQAWEGETIRRARDGKNKQRIVITNPQLSLLLSGTLSQLQPLLRSQENGLTSRMLCYLVSEVQGFDSRVFGQDIVDELPDTDSEYANLADYLQALVEWQEKSNHDCQFLLTDEQAATLTSWFSDMYEIVMTQFQLPIGLDASLKRLAVTIMRIGLILNVVRLRAEGDFPTHIVCTNEDFSTMMTMADVLLSHMVDVIGMLPEEESMDTDIVFIDRHQQALERQKELFSKLENEFTRHQVLIVAQELQIPDKTVDRWLIAWQKNHTIARLSHGRYRKLLINSRE